MDPRDIVTTRTFPASRDVVFEAFKDPERLARWWGPAGATNEFHEFDLREGGKWRLTLRMPGGGSYPMEKTFLEVEPGRRVVVAHRQPGHDFDLAMDYEDAPGGTRLTWRMRFATPEQLAAVATIVAQANEQNFDRLMAELQS